MELQLLLKTLQSLIGLPQSGMPIGKYARIGFGFCFYLRQVLLIQNACFTQN